MTGALESPVAGVVIAVTFSVSSHPSAVSGVSVLARSDVKGSQEIAVTARIDWLRAGEELMTDTYSRGLWGIPCDFGPRGPRFENRK